MDGDVGASSFHDYPPSPPRARVSLLSRCVQTLFQKGSALGGRDLGGDLEGSLRSPGRVPKGWGGREDRGSDFGSRV